MAYTTLKTSADDDTNAANIAKWTDHTSRTIASIRTTSKTSQSSCSSISRFAQVRPSPGPLLSRRIPFRLLPYPYSVSFHLPPNNFTPISNNISKCSDLVSTFSFIFPVLYLSPFPSPKISYSFVFQSSHSCI